MKSTKKLFAIALAGIAFGAAAQNYPSRPVTLVVPYPPGGSSDAIARIIGTSMGLTLKQPIIIENDPGAGGTVGTAKVARSPNDGYWLLLHNVGMAVSPTLYRRLPYKNEDLVPIGAVATVPSILVARRDLPAKNLEELLAFIKKNPSNVNFGHSGVGSAAHLCGLLFQSSIKSRLTTIAYKGGAPALNDLMGGQFDFMCEQATLLLPYIQSGKVKAIAVADKKRIPQLPNLPSTDESGLPGVEAGVWHGIYAPRGTPKEVIDKVSAALEVALRDKDVQKRLTDIAAEVSPPQDATPAALARIQQSDTEKLVPILKATSEYAD